MSPGGSTYARAGKGEQTGVVYSVNTNSITIATLKSQKSNTLGKRQEAVVGKFSWNNTEGSRGVPVSVFYIEMQACVPCVCVCVSVHACVRACVSACLPACVSLVQIYICVVLLFINPKYLFWFEQMMPAQ